MQYIVTMQYMSARLIARAKEIRDDETIVEIVIWQLDEPLAPCRHCYKYRLFYGAMGECRVRYDNERGKGDHRHHGLDEHTYTFIDIDTLLADFERDVNDWSGT
jgi:hypothetical protein